MTEVVVLTSADSSELATPLVDSLAAWCGAGLLGEVVWVPASELSRAGDEASCFASVGGEWKPTTLREAMSSQSLSKVWLAALRHPSGPGGEGNTAQARQAEEEAHAVVSSLLGDSIPFCSMTVTVASRDRHCSIADCSPVWDFHLVHDPKAVVHESAPVEAADKHAPLGLCAMVALCVCGGWNGGVQRLDLPSDRADGPFKPVRFVHCQIRVLHAPSQLQLVSSASLPISPPWPLPSAAGVERALPRTVPPLSVAIALATACGFQCQRPPYRPDPDREWALARWWRGLFRAVPLPVTQSDHEKALYRLADRTGGLAQTEDYRGVIPLKLDDADDLTSLVSHLQRSDFPLPGGASSASRPTPAAWQTLRGAMFGLVDGSTMPGGIPHPQQGEGGDAVRLVWTDPAGVAPQWAPADASDIFLGPDASAEDEPSAGREMSDQPDDDDGGDSGDAVDSSGVDPDGPGPEAGAVEPGPERGTLATGGLNDVLMVRMAGYLHQAMKSAQRGFSDNAALRLVAPEYDEAVTAQKRSRRLLAGLGVVLAFVAMFALDQRWPFLGDAWELVTRSEAKRAYDPLIWPIGWFVVGGLVLVVGFVVVFFAGSQLMKKLHRLEEGNLLRHRFGENASHYAFEILRLKAAAEQFADHRLIITEFLHRPFGNPEQEEDLAPSASEFEFGESPPPSMLVACAAAAPQKADATRQQRQGEAINQGWVTGVYREVMAVWDDRYQQRIVGDYEDPDHDTTQPGTVLHKDRHDGSDVFGARTDFARSVVGSGRVEGGGWAEGSGRVEGGGWAVRRAAAARFTRESEQVGGVDGYLSLLLPIEPVHGSPAGIGCEASRFLTMGRKRHWFAWSDVLAPGADAPNMLPPLVGHPWLVSEALEGRSLVMAWCLDLSEPVRPQDQAGWRDAGGREGTTAPRRPVV
ncbi:hypothetical protein [Candidatus Poriferisocius sp.]|uniref:hypothetical protein n=1 Tax=Candidatus Poriferisocius sp. TaxID=3101276 RepID=UPI003B01C16C